MKRSLLVIALCLAFAGAAAAQDTGANAPATKEDIERYLEATHSRETMLTMVDAMSKPLHQSMHEQFLKDKDKLPPDFETRMDKFIDDMMKQLPFDEIMQAEVPVYQKHFTKGDVDGLIAFYNSPTGQKMMKELPQIMAESMQSMMPIMQQYMQKVAQRTQAEVAAMMKNQKKPPTQPAT